MDNAPIQGPCIPHCYCKPVVTGLAYTSLGYTIASAVYVAVTWCMATPFYNTLTPDQKKVLRASRSARMRVFGASVVFSALILVVARPLRR
jgi:uncharacterized membrane protein